METENFEQNEKNSSIVINVTKRPNSYEFGKAGNRFKLYFEDAEDLQTQINKLKEKGLYNEEN